MTISAKLFPLFVLLLAVIFATCNSLPRDYNIGPEHFFNDSIQTSLRCGEVFSGNNSGGIFYKPFEGVDLHERCVWIIATPGAVGYTVNIQKISVVPPPPYHSAQLILTGVRHGGTLSPVLTSHLVQHVGEIRIEDANLLIVTFVTDHMSLNTGFVLQFQGVFTGNVSPTSPTSTHHVLQAPAFEFGYPASGNYVDNELAAIVLAPTDNIYSASSSQVWYKRNSMEEGCFDFVTIFKFNPWLEEKWVEHGRLCSDVQYEHFFHDDIWLAVFQSDGSNTEKGFWLYYLNCLS